MARKTNTTQTSTNALDTAIAAAGGKTTKRTAVAVAAASDSSRSASAVTKPKDAPAKKIAKVAVKKIAPKTAPKTDDKPVKVRSKMSPDALRRRGIMATISRKLGKGLVGDVAEIMTVALEEDDQIRYHSVAEMIERMGDGSEKRAQMAADGIVPKLSEKQVEKLAA